MRNGSRFCKAILVATVVLVLALGALAATVSSPKRRSTRSDSSRISESSSAKRRISRLKHSRRVTRAAVRRGKKVRRAHRYYERFNTSSFADDIGDGDITSGEDPVVRAAAVEALGNMNGSVLAIDPSSGRILSMVNQKLALSEGAMPCSTIKVSVALAALSENVVTKETKIMFTRRFGMDMTQALAHSNNTYFEILGRRLGFDKVSYYAHQFGLGELAGWNVEGEHLGVFPDHVLDDRLGGVGKMCSFGESISLTPLQLGALMGAIANGGTLYYLQHPMTGEEVANYTPHIKRNLNIAPLIPMISDGMSAAVQYGTARLLRTNFMEEPVLGKTGTCSKDGTRFGWFASYADTQYGRIVVVVFLRGGHPTFGPKAAEIAGRMYRNLYDHSFFAAKTPEAPVRTEGAAVGVSQ